MTYNKPVIKRERRRPNLSKKLRISTIILVSITVILAIALVFSLIVIDKLNKNNLFSKSIFLSNDYFLGSIAIPDKSDGTNQGNSENPDYVDDPYDAINRATNAVVATVDEYISENRDMLMKKYGEYIHIYDSIADGSYYDEYEYDKGVDLREIYDGHYLDAERMVILLKGDYSDIIGTINSIYWDYGICDAAHETVRDFLIKVYDIYINVGGCDKKVITVPYISQEGILPNGCEAVSATMLLQYAGMNISATDFVDKYLECQPVKIKWGCRYGPNPKLVYAGDPYSTDKGYGCYAPVIVSALNRVENRKYYAKNISGLSLSDIKEQYLNKDIPVAVWVTVHMEEVSRIIQWQSQDGSQSFLYPSNEHCMVLVGYDEDSYYFNDPYDSEGLVSYPAKDCVLAYNSLGMQAVAVIADK